MPACEGNSCSVPNIPGLHTISARRLCAAIRQCPIPTHPVSPVTGTSCRERDRLELEGHFCWGSRSTIWMLERAWMSWEMQTKLRCGSYFEPTEGWLSLSNQTVVVESAWGLSELVDPEALPIPWVRAAQSLPSCVREINSDTCCLLPALVSSGSNMKTEPRATMCSGQDDSSVGRSGPHQIPKQASALSLDTA